MREICENAVPYWRRHEAVLIISILAWKSIALRHLPYTGRGDLYGKYGRVWRKYLSSMSKARYAGIFVVADSELSPKNWNSSRAVLEPFGEAWRISEIMKFQHSRVEIDINAWSLMAPNVKISRSEASDIQKNYRIFGKNLIGCRKCWQLRLLPACYRRAGRKNSNRGEMAWKQKLPVENVFALSLIKVAACSTMKLFSSVAGIVREVAWVEASNISKLIYNAK